MRAQSPSRATSPTQARAGAVSVALLGVGTVGHAFLQRLHHLRAVDTGLQIRLVHVANSRAAVSDPEGLQAGEAGRLLTSAGDLHNSADPATALHARGGTAIVVDATASDAVACRHSRWLARGVHVVTASKLGRGGALARWREIEQARRHSGAHYGDSATVGAGLPLLRSLRALREGGDGISSLAGVMSGSLAWLFDSYDGLQPFAGFLRQAHAAGYTEPDPREDLSGEDVRRKLLILARASGFALEAGDVEVESLVPPSLAALPRVDLDGHWSELDVPMRERFAQAYRRGERLRHVARLQVLNGRVRAKVGLESLPAEDPLANGCGTDNRVAIWSDRYAVQPLVIQGPGAGADVTAAALLDDVLAIARH